MDNTPDSPFQIQVPSAARLLKSVLAALVIAALVLTVVVLPAEYAIDPTGIGSKLGLTQMHQGGGKPIALKDTLGGNENLGKVVQVADAGEPLPLPNPAVYQAARLAPKNETVTIKLPVGGETEVKAVLGANKVVLYSWKTDKGPVYVDFHGHSPDWTDKRAFVRYLEAKDGIVEDHGSLVAPFAGEHGWYWVNIGDDPVTITLQVSGYYDEIKNYGAL
ncbi:MAG: hypothetical protein U1F39_09830 [Steroidobacteraceae bacterium]